MYGQDPITSPDYSRIISDKRYHTLTRYLVEGEIIFGDKLMHLNDTSPQQL
jgi:hypothetical protein